MLKLVIGVSALFWSLLAYLTIAAGVAAIGYALAVFFGLDP
jgi:hypothetical protein